MTTYTRHPTYNKMDLHQAADRVYGTVHLLRSSHLPDTRRNEMDPFQTSNCFHTHGAFRFSIESCHGSKTAKRYPLFPMNKEERIN